MYTREDFEKVRKQSAGGMAKDEQLRKDALDVLARADRYHWIHQTNWLGEPILNLPQDMFAIQEIIIRTRPKYVIELGIGWGGAILFYATVLALAGRGEIIGVDTYLPDTLSVKLRGTAKLIKGSSTDPEVVEQIKEKVGKCKDNLIILDSHHTQEHVLKELEIYSPMVGKGNYLVCSDTIIEYIPEQKHRKRDWGPGNNPKTALDEFLKTNKKFKIDEELSDKLLFTCNPGGYLVRE
jgi:cephalosporin hydroxylase